MYASSTSIVGSYAYDSLGIIKTYTPALPAGYGTISYEYNALGQKTSMTIPLGIENRGRKLVYKYDNTGKQIGMEVVPVTVTSSVTPPANAGSGDTRFFYDDNQNRVKMITTTGNVYYFVYDPTASIPAVVYEQGPTNRYLNIREPDGSLISRETYDASGVRTMSRTYHFDGLGSTIALTDEGGAVTDTYSYDAWGNATHTSGSTSDNPYQYVGQLGYYTHYQEPTFGLLQLGVRYYDPQVGRFTERDPAKDGENPYAYAGGNPVISVDPTGLRSWDVSKDAALVKCLSRIRRCLPQLAGAVALVRRWYIDDSFDKTTCALTSWERQGWLPPRYWPIIGFNPKPGKDITWPRRYSKYPVHFHYFCERVLEELLHVSHGMAGTAWDNCREGGIPIVGWGSDPMYVAKEARQLYWDNYKCLRHD